MARQKREADHDAILLANRIAMLDNEQSRLLKKIENTRKRAEQIVEVKKNNEIRAARLAEQKMRQEEERQAKQLRILKERKQRKVVADIYKQSKFEQM